MRFRPSDHSQLDGEIARQRDIAILLQRALSLHDEVERRKKLESELRQQTAEQDDFLENALVAMHRVAGDGTILWANNAELSLLGYAQLRILRQGPDVLGRVLRQGPHLRPGLVDCDGACVKPNFCY